MKKILIALVVIVALVVVLVIGGVVLGLTQIDKIVKAGIERGGTYAMQVDTTVDAVDVSVTGGTASMSGLNIANPTGFDSEHFLLLGDASASINLETIGSDTIVMPTITLSGIDVILDKGANPSNYNTILNSLKRFESGGQDAPPADENAKKLVIDSLKLQDINIRLANMPGVSMAVGDVAVNIPEIELRDVGKEESMTTAEVINLVVKTVLAAAVEAGGGIIPGDVLGDLSGGLAGLSSFSDLGIEAVGDLGKQLNEQLGGATEQAQKVLDDAKKAGEDIQDSVNETTDKLKNIFGGNKEDEP